jgi:hypothetical protein
MDWEEIKTYSKITLSVVLIIFLVGTCMAISSYPTKPVDNCQEHGLKRTGKFLIIENKAHAICEE